MSSSPLRALAYATALLILQACGGGRGDVPSTAVDPVPTVTVNAPGGLSPSPWRIDGTPSVDGLVYTFQRTLANERTVLVINYGTTASTASVAGLPASAVLTRKFPAGAADAAADAYGTATFTVPAQSMSVFAVRS